MFFTFLNKPFPRSEVDKRSFITNFFVGCFVALFLIVFEPFDIAQWQTDKKELKLIGFGLVSFVIPILVSSIIARIIHKKPVEDNWTIGKEIIVILIILLCIAFANMLYSRLFYIMPFTWNGFLFAFMSVLLIGIFPVTLHVLRKHNKLLKINLEQAIIVNKHLHPVVVENKSSNHLIAAPQDEGMLPNEPGTVADEVKTKISFVADNEKDKLEIFPEQILYIFSASNYSTVVFIEKNILKKEMIRSSLKRIESQIKDKYILRCHRAFIVNLHKVNKIEGNAAGYNLYIDNAEDKVPVSRNYGPTVIAALKAIQ
ncbi:MAG: LytTR family transcriptional regulator [Bacteroidetes bacterium]|nr:LytTR family transcriptional regulator [Bacteroidota bacterium]